MDERISPNTKAMHNRMPERSVGGLNQTVDLLLRAADLGLGRRQRSVVKFMLSISLPEKKKAAKSETLEPSASVVCRSFSNNQNYDMNKMPHNKSQKRHNNRQRDEENMKNYISIHIYTHVCAE
jgi:hypothetical protein